jgi:Sortase domain
MVPSGRARRPLLGSTLLALVLAVGTVAGAVGRDAAEPASPIGASSPAIASVSEPSAKSVWVDPEPEPKYDGRAVNVRPAANVGTALGDRSTAALLVDRARSAPATSPKRTGAPDASAHRGRNHVWMPALGIDRSISFYSCSNGSYPGNRVYRWGCAGGNNVYLFGHASGVFKPLHDAYVRGRLQRGMKLYYADANGTVRAYTVSWWKLTTATKGTWAYKGLSSPSLTLQTCVGSKSQYRLIVRLAQVD